MPMMLTPMPMTMTTMHDGQIMITLARLVDYSMIINNSLFSLVN